MRLTTLLAIALLAGAGCKKKDKDGDNTTPSEPSPLLDVEETESWTIPGMTGTAYVVRTEMNIPHVYADNLGDLGRVSGFVGARDRYFLMELNRRFAKGELTALLGDLALETDLESVGNGSRAAADNFIAMMNADPDQMELNEGYAAGINFYIEQVAANALPAPSELELAGPFLGASTPSEMMDPWTAEDVAAATATFLFISGFETTDVGRDAKYRTLETLFDGAALEDLRKAGIYDDLWEDHAAPNDTSSAEGWGLYEGGTPQTPPPAPFPTTDDGTPGVRPHVPQSLLDRVVKRNAHMEARLGHDREQGFGSNAWAVAGSHSTDGRSYLAGDGHLGLTVPNLFYQMGLDTEHLGGGDLHSTGMVIPGMPVIVAGTNGDVAWVSTQFFGDITDWYVEEVELDSKSQPKATRSGNKFVNLKKVDEKYVIRDIPLLGSVGRTETVSRWELPDGRWLGDIEGTPADADTKNAVNMRGDWIVPGDVDGDGIVTGISFAYAGLTEGSDAAGVFMNWNTSTDVYEFREASRGIVAFSQNMVAADADGNVYYSGFQAMPCREYLPRKADGVWKDGADPRYLLDGTKYGAFTIPMKDGIIDESSNHCTVPLEDWPSSINPKQGYVLTANNDPGNVTTDGSLYDDPHYIGGPWMEGYRAKRIDSLLSDATKNGWADQDGMAVIQGDHFSTVGEQFVPVLLEAIAAGRAADPGSSNESEARMAALYDADSDRFDEVESRVEEWLDDGLVATSGVETFYHSPAKGDGDRAVATTLYNAWVGRFVNMSISDEGYSGFYPTGDTGRTRMLTRMLDSRGNANKSDMASWNPDTRESAYWDILGTPEIETSNEVALLALTEALDHLETDGEPDGRGGGFGTTDMDAYLWGLRHMVRFESTLGDFIGDDPDFAFLVDPLSITTDTLPLADNIPFGDERKVLKWFPRPGDHLIVDASNSGFGGNDFSYGSGPVFRMVVGLGGDGPTGQNILPGGQSGITDSAHFADQSALWLANETVPMRITVDQVIEGAVGRETYK